MVNFLRGLLTKKYFFLVVVLLFIAQSYWFAISIKPGIPPDETYHTKFIKYYSEQPLLSGPIISDQDERMFELGDIQRVPSYLYHYLMSFPQRIFNQLNLSGEVNTLLLRLLNILMSVFALVALKRLLEITCRSRALINATLAMLTLTGMFVWISAAVSYDNLSLLSLFGLLYFAVKFVKNKDIASFFAAISLAMLAVLIKFTVAPIVLLIVIACGLFLYREKWQIKTYISSVLGSLKNSTSRFTTIVMLSILLVSSLLFAERIVGNLIIYNSVAPDCSIIHTEEQCLKSSSYRRTKIVETRYQELVESGQQLFQPDGATGKWIDTMFQKVYFYPSRALFVGLWTKTMYERLYFYYGHIVIPANDAGRLSVSLIAALVLLSIPLKNTTLLDNKWEKLFFIIFIGYVLQLFFFNLFSYLNSGAMLAYQGRYLLPVIAFFYYFSFKLISISRKSLDKYLSPIYTTASVVVIIWFVLVHFPGYVFIKGSNHSWYTDRTKDANVSIKDGLRNLSKSLFGD